MRSFRAPPDHRVRVTRGEDLFDIEVEIGKRRNVQLQELPSAFVTSKRGRKGVGFPRHLRVHALDERINIMRIPGSEDLADDV
jgi:hypothetical protein